MKATVVQCHTTKWHKNPISGHEWPEVTLVRRWTVQGGKSLGQEFGSLRLAEEHAAFLNSLTGEPNERTTSDHAGR